MLINHRNCRSSHVAAETQTWHNKSISDLIHHILEVCHAGLRDDIKYLKGLMSRCDDCNIADHEAMASLSRFFGTLSNDLLQHITLEEQNDFPVMLAGEAGDISPDMHGMLERFQTEHDEIGEELLGQQFGVLDSLLPLQDTPQMREIQQRLQQFRDALEIHVFLEKHILLPKVLELLNNDKAISG